MKGKSTFGLLFSILLLVVGCKLTITLIEAPENADTGTVITLNVTCKATDTGADGTTQTGLVLQLLGSVDNTGHQKFMLPF